MPRSSKWDFGWRDSETALEPRVPGVIRARAAAIVHQLGGPAEAIKKMEPHLQELGWENAPHRENAVRRRRNAVCDTLQEILKSEAETTALLLRVFSALVMVAIPRPSAMPYRLDRWLTDPKYRLPVPIGSAQFAFDSPERELELYTMFCHLGETA